MSSVRQNYTRTGSCPKSVHFSIGKAKVIKKMYSLEQRSSQKPQFSA